MPRAVARSGAIKAPLNAIKQPKSELPLMIPALCKRLIKNLIYTKKKIVKSAANELEIKA